MADIYRVYLFEGWTWDTNSLWIYYGKLLVHAPAWRYFSPLGVFAGGITAHGLAALLVKPASPDRAGQTTQDRATELAGMVDDAIDAEPHVKSLRAEIRNIARSEIGHLFKLPTEDNAADDDDPSNAVSVLELPKAIEEVPSQSLSGVFPYEESGPTQARQ